MTEEPEDIGERLAAMHELPELPSQALSTVKTQDIDDDWIADAEPEEQVAAMVHWFLARFEDPANETPYITAEGGYIWIHGGPYEASEEIGSRFGDAVSQEAIEFASRYVEREHSVWDWAPTHLTYYDEEQDLVVEDKDLPLERLRERLDDLLAVLDLQGSVGALETSRNLAYAGVISALETHLWEVMTYWVDHDDETVKGLIGNHPDFKDRKISLGSIFEAHRTLALQVKAHMQRMVWHRWDEAARFIEHGLGVDPPSFKPFKDPTIKRHDVVHRAGHDVDGNPVNIVNDDVRALARDVEDFATELHRRIVEAKTAAIERDAEF